MLGACAEPMDRAYLEQKYTDSTSRFISVDGNRVHVRDEGEGEVIVLIHGTASSLHTWDQWTENLHRHYRVVRMDLPGLGLTGPDRNDRYEVADDVRFIQALLNKMDVGQVHIVGSSLGGRIAWQFALELPQRVKSLTLINALGYKQESWPPPIQLAQWPVFDTLMSYISPRFMYAFGLRDVYYDASLVNEKLIDRYFELSRYPGNVAAFPKRVKARLDQDEEWISQVRLPTLVLWGEEDQYFPVESAYRFHADIQGAELKIYPKVGHLPMEELPEQSVRDFKHFLAKER